MIQRRWPLMNELYYRMDGGSFEYTEKHDMFG